MKKAGADRLAGESACPTLRQAANSLPTNPEGVKDNSPWRKPWVGPRSHKPRQGRKIRSRDDRIPIILTPLRGWAEMPPDSHGLRRGLLSFTPSGLKIVAAREETDEWQYMGALLNLQASTPLYSE